MDIPTHWHRLIGPGPHPVMCSSCGNEKDGTPHYVDGQRMDLDLYDCAPCVCTHVSAGPDGWEATGQDETAHCSWCHEMCGDGAYRVDPDEEAYICDSSSCIAREIEEAAP